jgi:hypothetical protein
MAKTESASSSRTFTGYRPHFFRARFASEAFFGGGGLNGWGGHRQGNGFGSLATAKTDACFRVNQTHAYTKRIGHKTLSKVKENHAIRFGNATPILDLLIPCSLGRTKPMKPVMVTFEPKNNVAALFWNR